MTRQKAARQPRANAEAGPDAEATVRAGSRISLTTVRDDRRDAPGAAAAEHHPLTEAQILVAAASWLTSLRDWLAEEIDLADGETVVLRRAYAERIREGLTRCAGLLDTLTVDPAQLPPLDDAADADASSLATPSTRGLQ